MKNFDVIIPVARKDLSFLPRVVDYLDRCIEGINKIYVLTANKNVIKLQHKLTSFRKCVLIDENSLVEGLNFNRVSLLLDKYAKDKHIRVGWYYQQFLKFAFAESNYCSDYYLSWDADTLPLAPIKFFSEDHILFNPKGEYNPNYFKTINNLLGFGKVADFSFISENMMFKSTIVREMLNDIEKASTQKYDWIEEILSSCDFSSAMPAFSEFETYGSYCFVRHPGLYEKRHLNTFREAGMICGRRISESRLRLLSFDLDVASFEISHEPAFPLNIPHLIARIRKNMFISPLKLFSKIKRKMENKGEHVVEDTLYRLPPKKSLNL